MMIQYVTLMLVMNFHKTPNFSFGESSESNTTFLTVLISVCHIIVKFTYLTAESVQHVKLVNINALVLCVMIRLDS